jgi:hypothetical protein
VRAQALPVWTPVLLMLRFLGGAAPLNREHDPRDLIPVLGWEVSPHETSSP